MQQTEEPGDGERVANKLLPVVLLVASRILLA